MATATAETKDMNIFSINRRDDGIAVVTINLPGESQNVLNRALMEEAAACADTLDKDEGLKGVIFISGKPGSFIAGADIDMLRSCTSAAEVTELSRAGQAFMDRIANFRVPVVAAIDGSCLGGGLELALACHGRVCTDSNKTALGVPEVMLGLLPGSGGTQRLPRQVGIQAALDMALTGKQIVPAKARRMGLVDDVVPAPILEDAAVKRVKELQENQRGHKRRRSWMDTLLEGNPIGRRVVFDQARKQAQKRSRGNYPALPRIIECVEAGMNQGVEKGLELEAKRFGELAMTPQARQLMNIYFATTAMKKDTGTDAEAQPRQVQRVAVLGAGLMGAGIAYVTTNKAELPVRLKDVKVEGLNKGMQHINGEIQAKVKRRSLTPFEADVQLNRVTPTLDYSGFNGIDMAIEAVFEDLDLKHLMVRDVETHGGERTIFATNTSSIPITRIAEGAERPHNVIGMHYFSPVEKMPLLEVIATEHTDPEVIATTVNVGRKQGKTVIVVKDGAGFYVNRILAPYINEACHMLSEGVPIDRIDETMLNFGFPVGPFALLDEVGLDVTAKVAPILHDAFGDRMKPVAEANKMIEDGRYGKKSEKGFYKYGGKKKKGGGKDVDESVYSLLGVDPSNQAPAEDIIDRTLLLMVNEAARCWDEGVIRTLRDGDIGAVFGIGFPPFRGGPFRYMDARGIRETVDRLQELQARHGERFAPAPILERMASNGETFHTD